MKAATADRGATVAGMGEAIVIGATVIAALVVTVADATIADRAATVIVGRAALVRSASRAKAATTDPSPSSPRRS